jgi:hypothetical protein
LWSVNRQALGDELHANLATRNQLYANVQNQIAAIAAANTDPLAKAKAQQLNAGIQQQIDMNNFKRSLMSGPTADNADPSTRVQFLVPPAQQGKVFDEIGAAQETAKSAPAILQAFDRAASPTHLKDYIPGMENADQKAIHALMGPTFKDIEGTVRQAAMDNMAHNTTPHPFSDTAQEIQTKRNALEGYLTSKMAAPNAKGFGIDLTKFPSTNVAGAISGTKIKTVGGVRYMRGPNGQAVPVK